MRMRLSRVGGFRSEEIAVWARYHLEPGTVVVSDALSCFSAVQQAGCIHQPFVTGSGPQSAQHPALTWVNTILGNVKRSFHGHVPPLQLQASAALPGRVLLPLQPPLLAQGDVSPPSHSSPCEPRRCLTECSSWLRIISEQDELGT